MSQRLGDVIISRLKAEALATPDLYDSLVEKGYSRSNCKTVMSRLVAQGRVRAAKLKLGKGAQIVFVDGTPPTPRLVARLVEKEFFGRPALNDLMKCCRSSHPVVTRVDVAKLAALEIGTPDKPDWSEVQATIDGLTDLRILIENSSKASDIVWVANKATLKDAGGGFSSANSEPQVFTLRERFRIEFVGVLGDWMRKNGFVGFRALKRAEPSSPYVNYVGLPFDLFGHVFKVGIGPVGAHGAKGHAVVGDVLFNECNVSYARSFVNRLRQVKAKTKQAPFAFILAKVFTEDAFRLLNAEGIFPWLHAELLGKKTADALQRITTIVEGFLRQETIDPQLFALVFDGLENFESLFGNLKGKLFEIVIGYFFEKLGYSCRLGWELESEDGADFDVDVRGLRTSEAIIVECKGIRRDAVLDPAEVNKHFRGRFPAARAKLLASQEPIKTMRALVLTTGRFDPLSETALTAKAFGSKSGTQYELWNRDKLMSEFTQHGLSDLAAVVEKYF